MPRLHNERSRSYPGRPVRYAIQLPLESATPGNMSGCRAGVSRGHSSSQPAYEGPNPEQGKGPSSSTSVMNPTGGAVGRRVDGMPNPDTSITRLRPGNSWEPPGADPHARWCGGWGRDSPGYPVIYSKRMPKATGFVFGGGITQAFSPSPSLE